MDTDLQRRYRALCSMLKHTWEDTLPDKETAAITGECLPDIDVDPARMQQVGHRLAWYQARVSELTSALKDCLEGRASPNAQTAVEKAEEGP